MTRYYAGIGSRVTPPDVLELIERVGRRLAALGFVVRSGHAPGADQAFERGAQGRAQIFLPWPGFECDKPVIGERFERPTPGAMRVGEQFHPAWPSLSHGGRLLHARNAHQVLGPGLASPASFVLCWTPAGSGSGGTGQALRVARAHGVPAFDLADPDTRSRIAALLRGARGLRDGCSR